MATFDQLLGFSVSELEAMSDDDLLKTLEPQRIVCPPIDIAVVMKAKEEKEAQENEKKRLKKLEKDKEKIDRKNAALDAKNANASSAANSNEKGVAKIKPETSEMDKLLALQAKLKQIEALAKAQMMKG